MAAPSTRTAGARCAPFTHSISTDVYYTLEGDRRAALTSPVSRPSRRSKLMKQMLDLSSANPAATRRDRWRRQRDARRGRLRRPAGGLLHQVPERAAAHGRQPGPIPRRCGSAALPKLPSGEGSTVFWTTGACLFKYGQNKEKAAEYMKALTYDQQIWQRLHRRHCNGTSRPIAALQVDLCRLGAKSPIGCPILSTLVRAQLDVARAITNHLFGLTQFQIGKPLWEKFLTARSPIQ